jgi:hypothetical protein
MTEQTRIGEVIEACATGYSAQCYDLYQSPALGSLVMTHESGREVYGVVHNVRTAGIEPGRRPIARGKDETDEEEIYRSNPQLAKLLRSEFEVLVVGYRHQEHILQYLPPNPARIHTFVYSCGPDRVTEFSASFDFLNILIKSHLEISLEELVGACLRQMAQEYGDKRHTFLVAAGKELATLLSSDYGQLKAVLKGLKNAAI